LDRPRSLADHLASTGDRRCGAVADVWVLLQGDVTTAPPRSAVTAPTAREPDGHGHPSATALPHRMMHAVEEDPHRSRRAGLRRDRQRSLAGDHVVAARSAQFWCRSWREPPECDAADRRGDKEDLPRRGRW
jgi:hypothetical protein